MRRRKMNAFLYNRKSLVSTNRTSRILSGASSKSSVENFTPHRSAGARSTFANLNKLWRDVNLLGLRISLHDKYSTSCSGMPSAYLPGLGWVTGPPHLV